ncbi:MAG: hypothetical protein FJ146_09575 [Deltaproteobacteria bacterium]|nr:hypothetical protein [Deltaproteobacteria bacterium]
MNGHDTTDPPELVALFDRRPQVIKPGLSRIQAALDTLAQPELIKRPTITVAGTNGKGTTSGFLWQLCAAHQWRVGLFSSPHLQHFRERIQLSRRQVRDEDLVDELRLLEREIPAEVYEPLSFFEINTLLALRLFARNRTDLNILEVGLGGRWDSTNVADPCLAIITSIGLDHQQWLGSTHEAIAAEKAGIMRPGRPVIWGGSTAGTPGATAVLRNAAAELQAPFWEQGLEFRIIDDELVLDLPRCPHAAVKLPQKARGWPPFLRDNFAKAAAAYYWLVATGAISRSTVSPQEALVGSIAKVDQNLVPTPPCMRARFDHIEISDEGQGARSLLLDVCHNIAGAEALIAGLRATGMVNAANPTLPALVSILADKDCDEILDILRQILSPMILFATSGERSWSADRLAPRHRDLEFTLSFAAAWQLLPRTGATTVICGSVHAVGEVMRERGIPLA